MSDFDKENLAERFAIFDELLADPDGEMMAGAVLMGMYLGTLFDTREKFDEFCGVAWDKMEEADFYKPGTQREIYKHLYTKRANLDRLTRVDQSAKERMIGGKPTTDKFRRKR